MRMLSIEIAADILKSAKRYARLNNSTGAQPPQLAAEGLSPRRRVRGGFLKGVGHVFVEV